MPCENLPLLAALSADRTQLSNTAAFGHAMNMPTNTRITTCGIVVAE